MMKKITVLVLILSLALLGTACEKNQKKDNSQDGAKQEQSSDQDDGFYFPGSDIEGGITLPEDTFE